MTMTGSLAVGLLQWNEPEWNYTERGLNEANVPGKNHRHIGGVGFPSPQVNAIKGAEQTRPFSLRRHPCTCVEQGD